MTRLSILIPCDDLGRVQVGGSSIHPPRTHQASTKVPMGQHEMRITSPFPTAP